MSATTGTTAVFSSYDGRPLGEAATATRDALLGSLEESLSTTPWNRLSIPEIARNAGKSAATFYQYFASIEDAFDVLAERVEERDGKLSRHLELIWSLRLFERRRSQ